MPTLAEFSAALTAAFEGLRLRAYRDSGGVLTIGIGHTGPDVVEGMTITMDQATALFAEDQAHLISMVIGRPLLEAAALLDFGFNCGPGELAKVLAGNDTVENPVHTTDRHGNVLAGLVTRRRVESLLITIGRLVDGGSNG